MVVGDGRAVDLPAQERELVPQHDDLQVLGAARANSEPGEPDHEEIPGTSHHLIVGPRPAGQPPRPSFRHPQGGAMPLEHPLRPSSFKNINA